MLGVVRRGAGSGIEEAWLQPGARSDVARTTASMHSVEAGILLAFGDWHLDTMNGLTTFWSKHLNLSGRY